MGNRGCGIHRSRAFHALCFAANRRTAVGIEHREVQGKLALRRQSRLNEVGVTSLLRSKSDHPTISGCPGWWIVNPLARCREKQLDDHRLRIEDSVLLPTSRMFDCLLKQSQEWHGIEWVSFGPDDFSSVARPVGHPPGARNAAITPVDLEVIHAEGNLVDFLSFEECSWDELLGFIATTV